MLRNNGVSLLMMIWNRLKVIRISWLVRFRSVMVLFVRKWRSKLMIGLISKVDSLVWWVWLLSGLVLIVGLFLLVVIKVCIIFVMGWVCWINSFVFFGILVVLVFLFVDWFWCFLWWLWNWMFLLVELLFELWCGFYWIYEWYWWSFCLFWVGWWGIFWVCWGRYSWCWNCWRLVGSLMFVGCWVFFWGGCCC